METFIVYIDDKQYALQQIVPMLSHQETSNQVSWVLVGCPPRLTRHSGRWLSQSAQKNGGKTGRKKPCKKLQPC